MIPRSNDPELDGWVDAFEDNHPDAGPAVLMLAAQCYTAAATAAVNGPLRAARVRDHHHDRFGEITARGEELAVAIERDPVGTYFGRDADISGRINIPASSKWPFEAKDWDPSSTLIGNLKAAAAALIVAADRAEG